MNHSTAKHPPVKQRGVAAAGALVLAGLFAVTGCAAPDRGCGVDQDTRPFGRRILPFLHDLAELPDTLGDEISYRSKLLGDEVGRIGDGRGLETERTFDHLGRLFPAIGEDVGERSGQFGETVNRYGTRVAQDLRCFFDRAWYSLKLAE